jgi:hypothetical protein
LVSLLIKQCWRSLWYGRNLRAVSYPHNYLEIAVGKRSKFSKHPNHGFMATTFEKIVEIMDIY